MPVLDGLADLGLVLFMFLIGLELDTRLVRRQGHQAATLANVGLVVPFTLGVAVALLLYPTFGAGIAFTPFALFLGVAMAVSALPVLAALLAERGLAGTRLGTLALSCAAAEDVAAWCLLAVVVALAQATNPAAALGTMAMAAGYAGLMLCVVRPLLRRAVARWLPDGRVTHAALAAVVVGLLLSAAATSLIGIHAIFGAFLFGVVLPAPTAARQALVRRIGDLTGVLLLPMFFAVSGMHTDLRLLGSQATAWAAFGLVMLAAVGGKLGAVTLAGRATGLAWRESTCLGVLLNTGGLTELVILGIGLRLGAIPEPIYALLVLMAVATTMAANPLLTRILPRSHEGSPIMTDHPNPGRGTPAGSYDAIVLGGGLAGLTLALQIKKARPNTSVLVLERRPHPVPEARAQGGRVHRGDLGALLHRRPGSGRAHPHPSVTQERAAVLLA